MKKKSKNTNRCDNKQIWSALVRQDESNIDLTSIVWIRFWRAEKLVERLFECLQAFADEEQQLSDFVKEIDGQMQVEKDKKIVVGKDENAMQIEGAEVEPDGEHVQKAENELADVLLVCGIHDLLQEIQMEA